MSLICFIAGAVAVFALFVIATDEWVVFDGYLILGPCAGLKAPAHEAVVVASLAVAIGATGAVVDG